MADDSRDIRVLTWNLFHGHDGARLGPTLGSTILKRPVDDGRRVHHNRTWIAEMAAVIASRAPAIAALQEVPPLAVDQLAQQTGMTACRSLMPPLVGTTRLRGRLAARNPDLWRTHEGTANVLLVAPPWHPVPGGTWTVRHNPPGFVLRTLPSLKPSVREAVHWLLEPRRLVAARVRHPDGRTLTAVSLHCHGSFIWELIGREVVRILPRLLGRTPAGEPLIVAGDLNAAGRTHPAIHALLAAGLEEPTLDDLVLDHIFHRGLEAVHPPRTLATSTREIQVPFGAQTRTVLLSDHEIVEATYRVPAASPT